MNIRILLAAAACSVLAVGIAYAGSLDVSFHEVVASEEYDVKSGTYGASKPGRYYHISVNANNAGYASYIAQQAIPTSTHGDPLAPYTRSFSDPVVGWAFLAAIKALSQQQ